MGFISTKTHGISDCLMVLAFLFAPRIFHFDAHLVSSMAILAGVVVSYSLLTRYEWGIVSLIPTRLHLIFDCLIGIGMFFLPLFTNVSLRQGYLLIAFGIFFIFCALLTPTRSPHEKKRFKNSLRARKMA